MKLQSIIESLQRKVSSARVPIRAKRSYALTPLEEPEPVASEALQRSLKAGPSDAEGSQASVSDAASSVSIADSNSSLSIASSNSDSESDSADWGTVKDFICADDDAPVPDRKTRSKYVRDMVKGKKAKVSANKATPALPCVDSDSLSETDFDVLRRHQHWEREYSQAHSTQSDPLKSQRSQQSQSRAKPAKEKVQRQVLVDAEIESMDSPTSLTVQTCLTKEEKIKASQSGAQEYLERRKRTWEIRSLNPAHSQLSKTSELVYEELEKSIGFSQSTAVFSQQGFHCGSMFAAPATACAAPQQKSVAIDDRSMQRFTEAMCPPVRAKNHKSPRKSGAVPHRQSIVEPIDGSPGKLKFPKNFED